KDWGPADRSFPRTTRTASADSEVRPGPRLSAIPPRHLKAGEAGPKAYPHPPCRVGAASGHAVWLMAERRLVSSGRRSRLRARVTVMHQRRMRLTRIDLSKRERRLHRIFPLVAKRPRQSHPCYRHLGIQQSQALSNHALVM